jgi:hypothetical protein
MMFRGEAMMNKRKKLNSEEEEGQRELVGEGKPWK